MQRLKSVFRDVGGLHARIDTYLARSSVLRIGLIPTGRRADAATVLDALVDEPIEPTAWEDALAKRPLSKDALVVQSNAFEYVETHNSLMVYPVPFPGPAAEYIEVSSAADSWEHLKPCHIHVHISNQARAGVESEYPSIKVTDAPMAATTAADSADVTYDGDEVLVDSKKALKANEILQGSPANASQFLEMRHASGIDFLRRQLVDRPDAVFTALKRSIIRSCEAQVAELPVTTSSADQRHAWAESAHRELQGNLLPSLRRVLSKDLAWYKLYARTDDIYTDVSHLVVDQGLVKSRTTLAFLEGKLAAPRLEMSTVSLSAATPAISRLHDSGLKAVLTALGVQIPIGLVAALGAYAGGMGVYEMGALGLLGLVVGLRRLQTQWLAATTKFENEITDVATDAIKAGELGLWELGELQHIAVSEERETMLSAIVDAESLGNTPEKADAQPSTAQPVSATIA